MCICSECPDEQGQVPDSLETKVVEVSMEHDQAMSALGLKVARTVKLSRQ